MHIPICEEAEERYGVAGQGIARAKRGCKSPKMSSVSLCQTQVHMPCIAMIIARAYS